MLGKDTCLLSKPVRLRLGVLPEFVYLWDKKKKIKPEGTMEWMHHK